LNGILFKMLFGRRFEALYKSQEIRLSAIERHLSKSAKDNANVPLQAETILVETFHNASIAAYQAEDEINSTFNLYLLIGGIIGAGLPTLQTLVLDSLEKNHRSLAIAFSVTATIMLVIVGILSLFFLERFLQLSKERFDNVETMNNIQDFYSRKLKAHLPELTDLFRKQSDSERGFDVPPVVFYTVSVIGSVYIGGATAIAAQTDITTIIFPIIAFILSLVFYLWFYRRRKSKMEKSQVPQIANLSSDKN
jgi:uncharacterized membrane protein YfcA